MEVTFEGIPSGDYECFCWDVDRETFIRLTGREPLEPEEGCVLDGSYFDDGLYKVYPSEVMDLPLNDERGKKYKFTLKVENVTEKESDSQSLPRSSSRTR